MMHFEVRMLTENDYPELCEYWKFWRFPAPPQDFLPENGRGGVMISRDGENIAAGFLFLNNSKIAWLEYIVRNPKYKGNDSNEAIEELIFQLCHIAKENGFKAVFTSLKSESLINRYAAEGFVKGTSNTTEMIKIL